MIRYLSTRLVSAVFVVFAVSCVVFTMIHLVPGDPVEVMLGETATAVDRDALRRQLGLDQPLPRQFRVFVEGLLRFDLGESLHSKRPVSEVLAERIPASIELAIASLTIAIGIAIPLGIIAAVRRGSRWDVGAMTFSTLGVSIPNFVMGPLLILVFAVWLKWLPVSGRDEWGALILPSLTLGSALARYIFRVWCAPRCLKVLEEDYIRTARAKGLGETEIVIQHGAQERDATDHNSYRFAARHPVRGGGESLRLFFSWPGIGHLTIEAIQRRDYPMLQACVLVISVAYVCVNTLTDIVYAWLDPRVRLDSDI